MLGMVTGEVAKRQNSEFSAALQGWVEGRKGRETLQGDKKVRLNSEKSEGWRSESLGEREGKRGMRYRKEWPSGIHVLYNISEEKYRTQ